MKRLVGFSLIVSIIFSFCCCDGIRVADHTQLVLVDEPRMVFRNGTTSDLDDITTTFLDAFGPAEDFRYRYPDLDQHRNAIWHCSRKSFRNQWFSSSSEGFVKVVAASPDSTGKKKVVSFGIWEKVETHKDSKSDTDFQHGIYSIISSDPSILIDDQQSPYDCSHGLGSNTTRVKYIVDRIDQARQEYPMDEYFELALLATHPDWDGNGFAAMSVKWGLEFAKQLRLPAVVISSREGFSLYRSLGFETLRNISIPKLEGSEHLLYHLMKQETF